MPPELLYITPMCSRVIVTPSVVCFMGILGLSCSSRFRAPVSLTPKIIVRHRYTQKEEEKQRVAVAGSLAAADPASCHQTPRNLNRVLLAR